ncbi:hypothetical protein GHO41_19190 [Pseudomonas sp. FSL R10-0399]|uniref:hypothetical protein n=1 Tax=Pseudomonas sp. FSL R10-0399 TaxID=2662194 RepID=UPI00129510ED|nr:hypothetical protein [Pseudomonas sp. FSL R10-0399]MQT59452.1 hypothetical protein [Pseudomonas sp. FSL R10-0399]
MHQSIFQRRAILEGLRERARQATADFYQKPGVMPPPLAPLIVVKPSGNNTFALINRATGVVVAERFGHNNATAHARELEAKEAQFNVKQFGKFLSSWTLRFGITLTVFAFFGSHI